LSIRLLALALYEAMRKEKELEKQIEELTGEDSNKKEQLDLELNKARQETEKLRIIIDGKKKKFG
jgi:hypothetical protein